MKKFAKGKKSPVKKVEEEPIASEESEIDEVESGDDDDEAADEEASGEEEVEAAGDDDDDEEDMDLGEESEEDDSEDDEAEDDDDVADDDETTNEKIAFDTPKSSKDNIISKYEARKGKQLYVRFPTRLPEDVDELLAKMKSLCGRIIKVHRPRQPWARFCTVDFESVDERNKGLKELKNVTLEDDQKLHLEVPKLEQTKDYINKIADLRQKQKDKKKAKLKLRKLAKIQSKTFTSSVVISNIPPTSTVSDIKELFPNAVDVNLIFAKGDRPTSSATVTLPTPEDASNARKSKLTLEENELRIKFAGLAKKGKGKAKFRGEEKKGEVKREADDDSESKPKAPKQQKVHKNPAAKAPFVPKKAGGKPQNNNKKFKAPVHGKVNKSKPNFKPKGKKGGFKGKK